MTPRDMLQLIRDQVADVVPSVMSSILRLGTVTSASPLYVQLDSETAAAAITLNHLGSYTPTLSDRVFVIKVGRTDLVIGKVV
jgi:hypothetical protein